jgi:acyl-CoA reductase-like NAD-dependent aldehyde dehydrogenase
VLADADLDAAASAATHGLFRPGHGATRVLVQREVVESFTERLVYGASADAQIPLRPTVLLADWKSAVASKEVRGPVIIMLPFTDVDDLLARTGDGGFGQAASIWTRDLGRMLALAGQLNATDISCNTSPAGPAIPQETLIGSLTRLRRVSVRYQEN